MLGLRSENQRSFAKKRARKPTWSALSLFIERNAFKSGLLLKTLAHPSICPRARMKCIKFAWQLRICTFNSHISPSEQPFPTPTKQTVVFIMEEYSMFITSQTQIIYMVDEATKLTWKAGPNVFELKCANKKLPLSRAQMDGLIKFFIKSKEDYRLYLAKGTNQRSHVFTARGASHREYNMKVECEEVACNQVLRYTAFANGDRLEINTADVDWILSKARKIESIDIAVAYSHDSVDLRLCEPHTEEKGAKKDKRRQGVTAKPLSAFQNGTRPATGMQQLGKQ